MDDNELYQRLQQVLRVFTYEADDPEFANRFIAPTPETRLRQWHALYQILDPDYDASEED